MKKNKILVALTTGIMCLIGLSCSNLVVSADEQVEDLIEVDGIKYWTLPGRSSVMIADCNKEIINAIIPEEINGMSVESITSSAFKDNVNLQSISLPNTITTIGENAFEGCVKLESITIPDSVTYIEDYAFNECSGLQNVNLGQNLIAIDQYAFAGCSGLRNITIPDSVVGINTCAFKDCVNLEKVTEPSAIRTLGGNIFMNTAFYNTQDSDLKMFAGWLIGYTGSNPVVKIPEDLNGIAAGVFQSCETVEEIIFPTTIKDIGNATFANCPNLKKVVIPGNVKRIGEYAFYNCKRLQEVNLEYGLETIEFDAFVGCPISVVCIPESVKKLYYCFDSGAIYIPKTVNEIRGLSASSIYLKLYYEGTKEEWETITYDEYSISADYATEYDCTQVDGVCYFIDVKDDDSKAYAVYGPGVDKSKIKKEVKGIPVEEKISVLSIFEKGSPWYEAQPDGMIYIDTIAYYMKGNEKECIIKDGTTEILRGAFSNKNNMSVTIPASVTSIEDLAYWNCRNMTVYGYGNQTLKYSIRSGNEYIISTITLEELIQKMRGGIKFVSIGDVPVISAITGDLNADGEFNISDAVLLQKWLLSESDAELADWKAADLYEDDKLDVFDMIEMRKLLVQNNSLSAQ